MTRKAIKFKHLILSLLTLALIAFTSQTLIARNYYFSTSLGNDTRTSTQAQNPTTPWKSISKLNSFFASLSAGDSVLFKRGETFYGSIIVAKSGTSALPIVIGAFGSGANPVITGFTTLTSWTSLGNGIYQSEVTSCKPTLNIVTVNGKNTPIGRFPNVGYLKYESHSGNTSITDNELAGSPNWTGAEVVVRKSRTTLARNLITNHTSNTITYVGSGENATNNNGYFIQNDPKTLDVLGEWYYNNASKRLHVYFGNANPTLYTIKVSTIDTLIYCNGYNYLTITNLNFEGANATAIYIRAGQNVYVKYCGINFSGNNAIWATSNINFKLDHCSINHSNHGSVKLNCSDASIRYNIIKNSGLIQGMAYEAGGYNGIEMFGAPKTIVEYNELDSIGGMGIIIKGDNITIKNNLINHFGYFLDDVGGIYTGGSAYTGKYIIGNIVLNGIGDISGTSQSTPGVKGIMLDAGSDFVEVKDNTVANCNVSGIHLNNSHDIIIRNNLLFNNRIQFLMQNITNITTDLLRNISINKNTFFSKAQTQTVFSVYSKIDDILLFGQADSNYFCRPLDDNYVVSTQVANSGTARALSGWQSYSGQDMHSKKSPQSVTSENDILFEYNASLNNKIIPLNAIYLGVDGTVYSNSITLLPYTSIVLIKSVNQNLNLAPVIQNQNFQINENSASSTSIGNVIASDPNSGQTLSYSIISGNTNGAFAINSTTGILSVANSTVLNYEITTSFPLIVKVLDNGTPNLSSQATITVKLLNLNEKPLINNQTFTTADNSANGTVIGTIIATDPDAGQTLSYSILSGNTNNAFSINSTTGILTVINSASLNYQTSPAFSLIIKVIDNGTGNLSNQANVAINLTSSSQCTATGNITYQIWNNIGGLTTLSSLTSNVNFPNNPTSSTLISSMEGTTNQADQYGSRIVGFLCAPATGSYTFWIASDNEGELWLSTDDQSSNKQKIAYINGATLPRAWNTYTTQKSVAINLVKGQTYYIEAFMKEAYGGDCLAVGWLKPGETGSVPSEVIPGSVLSPFVLISSVSLPATSSVNIGSDITLLANISPTNASNNSLTWSSNNPAIAAVNSNGLITGILSGTVTITATTTDGSNKSATCIVTVNSNDCSATGNITYQIWNNIGGSTTLSSLTSNVNFPNNPTSSTLISSMEGTTNRADQYGSRIVGFLCAPATGSYIFWIASDNEGELWLSTDDQSSNRQKIAYINGATLPRAWNTYTTQKSVSINLVKGQTYYIEALMKEAYGGDCLAVGWLKPGETGSVPSEVIPGSVLSPIVTKSKEITIEYIEQDKSDIKLSVYPNPLSNDELKIQIENLSSEAILKIFTVTGVECFNKVIHANEAIHIDRSIFKSGIYVVKVFNENLVISTKLIVN